MNIDAERLRGFLDCMHTEADERDKRSAQISAIVKVAKEAGFDTKAVRKVFVRERMDASERTRQDDLLVSYEHALGAKGKALAAIRAGTPVGEAAATYRVHRATLARSRSGESHVANGPSNATGDGETGIRTQVTRESQAGDEPTAINRSAISQGAADTASPASCTTPHDPETGEINGEEDTERHVERTGQEDPVCGQPDSEDAGGDAGTVRGLGDGEDDNREDDCGAGGEGQAELAPPPTTNADGMEIPPFLRRERASA